MTVRQNMNRVSCRFDEANNATVLSTLQISPCHAQNQKQRISLMIIKCRGVVYVSLAALGRIINRPLSHSIYLSLCVRMFASKWASHVCLHFPHAASNRKGKRSNRYIVYTIVHIYKHRTDTERRENRYNAYACSTKPLPTLYFYLYYYIYVIFYCTIYPSIIYAAFMRRAQVMCSVVHTA